MYLGIDLGGTKIEGVLLGAGGDVLRRERRPTPRDLGYGGIVAGIATLAQALDPHQQTPGIGLGIPGTIDRATGRVKNANTTELIGQPLPADLEARSGRRVRLANDANCFAVAEALGGAAKGYSVVFGVILGTGVGGGLVIDGQAREGLHGIAGEWGHSPLHDGRPDGAPAPRCYCGLLGCVETRLCGPALERDYQRLSGSTVPVSAQEIAERVARGDAAALQAIERYLEFFGEALARVIHVLDPDAVVLGGGLGQSTWLYQQGPAAVERYIFNDRFETPLLRPALGDSAGVFGAAWLWGRPAATRSPAVE